MRSDLRLSRAELDEWQVIPTAVISDEQGHKGILDPAIRSLFGLSFAGQAHTIRTVPEANPAAHWAISLVERGDVILIDGRCYPDGAIWGGNMICAAAARGLAGLVVDGNVRDSADLRASGVAVHARRVQAAGWDWGGVVEEPIVCGGVEVAPGDLVVGDGDGVAVVRLETRVDLLRRCRARIARDDALQAQIRAGRSTLDILKLQPMPGTHSHD